MTEYSTIWDFDSDTKIAYVSGTAGADGARLGSDSIFGVNPISESLFFTKEDFSTGDVLENVVYVKPGGKEGVQLAMKGKDQIQFFIQCRDTINNMASGDGYVGMDTLDPAGAPHYHVLAKMGGAPVGMEELSGVNVLVYPNPAQNQLFI